ncbi:PREDICTED: uncharacterized protein LOC18603607 isoform X1 [Theobroma cacao]|uniref:Uncharacterized protein LOC18603607 isoform X1 n=1 Tax=Theobroma cacao TaxID=3641 RepID=A0AB32W8A6_THECC|nr:PREDICTED: uncharacterized protein LOC18603607 isoform X1 [Theobroma cacao]XP_017974126.1 PREDICTED: uncharacterized protein LOC18603607 isoform X1 [Theobroma cacao]
MSLGKESPQLVKVGDLHSICSTPTSLSHSSKVHPQTMENKQMGKADEGLPQTGGVARDPAQIVAKALLCFNDKYIYSSCEESCRLTASGNLGVPPGYIDEYCSGPCLSETHLVLNCIENIMTNFLFYNRATIQDIRDTIQAGCGYGPERGDFNVEEHIEAEGSSATKAATQILIGIGSMIIACTLLL